MNGRLSIYQFIVNKILLYLHFTYYDYSIVVLMYYTMGRFGKFVENLGKIIA